MLLPFIAVGGDRGAMLSRKVHIATRPSMETLVRLLDRLKARQRDLIMEAAQYDTMPADSTLKRIAELENAIAAVEAVADEERGRQRK